MISVDTTASSDFADKPGTAVVVGGSGGIGAAIARRLVQGGSHVCVTYRTRAPHELLDELGDRAEAHPLSLPDAQGARELFARILENHRSIHSLVHAAGPHVPMVHLSRVPPEQFAAQLDEDVNGIYGVIHAALPALRESRGSITAITSAATRRYPVRDGLSAAPKGAVEALMRGLAAEEGRYGIRVNCVGPGMLHDGMSARLQANGDLDERALAVAMANIPLRRFGSAGDIAETVAFLASDRAAFITGQKLDVDGGYGV